MTDTIEKAAQYLVAARHVQQTGSRLPEALRPTSVEDALAVQERVNTLLQIPIGGWKCLLPPKKGMKISAPIYAENITEQRYSVKGVSAKAEPEIAFVVGQDLPPRVTPYRDEEIRAAIKETRLVLEMIGSRYAHPADCSDCELLADRLQNDGMVVGPCIADAEQQNLSAFPVKLIGPAGEIVALQGKHPNLDPFLPFVWHVHFLNARGMGLKRGQIVTTGSYAGLIHAPLNIPLRFQFGSLGVLSVEFIQSSQ